MRFSHASDLVRVLHRQFGVSLKSLRDQGGFQELLARQRHPGWQPRPALWRNLLCGASAAAGEPLMEILPCLDDEYEVAAETVQELRGDSLKSAMVYSGST